MAHVIQCDVCNHAIKKPEDGRVIGDYFGRFVESAVVRAGGDLDKALDGPDANFVNAITRCYFIQFEDHFHADGSGMKAFAKFERTRMDEKARLAAVVKDYPKTKDLWLIVHTACIPDELGEGGYPIGAQPDRHDRLRRRSTGPFTFARSSSGTPRVGCPSSRISSVEVLRRGRSVSGADAG